jgi:hypothetical protein
MASPHVPCKLAGMERLRVLVLGGYGLFGSRLAERLALHPELHVIISGRTALACEAAARRLQGRTGHPVSSCALDTNAPDFAKRMADLQPQVVVHCAGPFQGQDYRVARACIEARAHYIDLADGREFVTGIAALDARARAAGVCLVSGASSVPGISSAVADELASGMQAVEEIDIGISPGNRTERGLSTVQSVLSYCGRPLDAPGQEGVFGWCGTWRQAYPRPVGVRLLSPCDVPDLALLPGRYAGSPRIRFGAGLELRFLHRGMNVLAWLARRRLVRGWERYASSLKRVSEWFEGWGSDCGAMHVRVRGRNARGEQAVREWMLVAEKGDGPYVPTLAATALVLRLAAGRELSPGAGPCVGCVSIAEILAAARGLAITAGESATVGIFQNAMGPAYERVDPAVRAFHALQGRAELRGEVETEAPASVLGALLAAAIGAPRLRTRGALRFDLECAPGQQTWTRHFPHRTMQSTLRLDGGELVETLGPTRLFFGLQEEDGALVMRLRAMRFLGVPCPKWLLPHVHARERGREGRLEFDIRASLPLIGQVTAYRGWLQLPEHA